MTALMAYSSRINAGTMSSASTAIGKSVARSNPVPLRHAANIGAGWKMRVLAVTGPKRLLAAPELPTSSELGFPGMTVTGSIGLAAPAGTSAEIIEQIAQASRTVVAESAFKQMLIDAGIEPTLDSNPEKFRRSLAADVALWTPIVKALGLKID